VPDAVGVAAAEDEAAAVELDAEVAEAAEDEVVDDDEVGSGTAIAPPTAEDGVPAPVPPHVEGREPEPTIENTVESTVCPPLSFTAS
jgi:hypothetical protein